MTIYLLQSIDCDGGWQGKVWTQRAFLTKLAAEIAAEEYMADKSWPDQEWQPYANWLNDKLPFEWDRWSNNRSPMVLVIRPIEVEE